MLLSKAYFLSTNCLREVDATIDQKKPIVPVHEGDVSRGGMPLDVLRDDCEAKERREAAIKIFDDGAIIRWHRVHEFQLQVGPPPSTPSSTSLLRLTPYAAHALCRSRRMPLTPYAAHAVCRSRRVPPPLGASSRIGSRSR